MNLSQILFKWNIIQILQTLERKKNTNYLCY